ncbi:MAG TPA: phosphonate C-P lyase system protein PhnG [Burkholderiales bacterium]|nr:phosphonate C-P lyase system protein PhnG [Burkholderiales bacterium]
MPADVPLDHSPTPNALRRRWMGVLARARCDELEALCDALRPLPASEWLRQPETGLAMVRGRIGGTGAKFNIGEMSLTRCAIVLASGSTGIGYVQGRSARHAELAALIDALMQEPARRAQVEAAVIDPLERAEQARRTLAESRAATTRVEFYTVVRGETNPSAAGGADAAARSRANAAAQASSAA